MPAGKGNFVISLDFELMWGVRDIVTPATYGEHIRGVHTAIPKMLSAFHAHDIKATFAAVGFLFFKDKEEILANLPAELPKYKDINLSPYAYLHSEVGKDYEHDKYHFGLPLIEKIKNTPGQEIATHTFSHYYCMEEGQDLNAFRHDLNAALNVAKKRDIKIESIIFPRNQVNSAYLEVCRDAGITSYRNNQESWIYSGRTTNDENLVRRFVRLLDAYINISGHHCYTHDYIAASLPFNIASSRFLRPYTKKLRSLESLRLRRIAKSMTHAAKTGTTFHLWWHPHNFGINQDQNMAFLEKILRHYQFLKKEYGFDSITMRDLSQQLMERYGK